MELIYRVELVYLLCHQQVVRFEVEVNDIFQVKVVHATCDLNRNVRSKTGQTVERVGIRYELA